ncbi:MAG: hypothetical protein ACRC1P_01475 [Cellulosilyticaceae bacterium]
MNKIVNQIKALPIAVKIGEIVFILSIIIFFFMVAGGGSFTTYYAMMGVIGTGGIAAAIAVFNKKWALVLVDLIITGGLFLFYLSIA